MYILLPSVFVGKNVAGAAIVMPSDGKFYRITNSGNKYRIYDAQDAIPVTGGGTGATDAAGARSAIGAAAASHDHSTSDITSGTLSVGRGGTGQTTLAAFRNSIGLGNSTSTLAIANGGTGATTAAGIRRYRFRKYHWRATCRQRRVCCFQRQRWRKQHICNGSERKDADPCGL